jgi:wyosine [tRNA(Phe)-imidazoG37] synthetase (radical SAM superfamily)
MSGNGLRCVYGPVPSRRLGRSLGIDLVPFKTCSYDCIYCQLGRTTEKTITRREYVPIAPILGELKERCAAGVKADYITLAGSGEPTLHNEIGGLIRGIKTLTDIPVAVLTNGSLLWDPEVRDSLQEADLVIPSLDAGDERLFRYVNRPYAGISFGRMVDGLAGFTAGFGGEVWLEVFLLADLTGTPSEARKIASLAKAIKPKRIQLNTVRRPPAESFARPLTAPEMESLSGLFAGGAEVILAEAGGQPPAADGSGVSDADILAILRRHPCTARDAAEALGMHATEALKRLEALAASGKVKTAVQDGKTFYLDILSGIPGGK